jgi:hypothetical protein
MTIEELEAAKTANVVKVMVINEALDATEDETHRAELAATRQELRDQNDALEAEVQALVLAEREARLAAAVGQPTVTVGAPAAAGGN